ncbi:MAG TPA: Clp1/GlmU family protein, partial [Actinomycetota bacterium]|nr:Clp1/GlmU family protein [Actinomycetota bacterium]
MNEHEALVEEAVRTKHTVLLFGGLDTGKSTLSRVLLETAVAAGRPSAFLDADVGQKTVGPPATVTLKMIQGPQDLEPASMAQEDGLWFVGSTSPEGHLLQVVTGVASLFRQAKEAGADFVVMDSSG